MTTRDVRILDMRLSMYSKIRLGNNFIKVMTVTLLICLSSIGYSQEKDVFILMKDLRDVDQTVRLKAANALRKMGTSAIEIMIAALKDKDVAVRRNAARAFYNTKDVRTVEPLIDALKDDSAYVRAVTAVPLGRIKDTRVVEPLIAALISRSIISLFPEALYSDHNSSRSSGDFIPTGW